MSENVVATFHAYDKRTARILACAPDLVIGLERFAEHLRKQAKYAEDGSGDYHRVCQEFLDCVGDYLWFVEAD